MFAAQGATALQFKMDDKSIALHSKPNTWQRYMGYNDIYDFAFYLGTRSNMKREKFKFVYNKTEYIIWTWKGDYTNLGTGAEIGLYYQPNSYMGIKQWKCINYELPMTLNSYTYYNQFNIDNVFCWSPVDPQWWITGFNPDKTNPKSDKMVSIGSIDFSDRTDMYTDIKSFYDSNDSNIKALRKYLVFDDELHVVWIIWWGE